MNRKVFLLAGFILFFLKASAADYIVNSINLHGAGSLDDAIITANNSSLPRPFEIIFNLPVGSSVNATLPRITRPVLIDGTQTAGYSTTPVITILGSGGAGGSGFIFDIGSDGSTVRGLKINNFVYGIIVSVSNCTFEKNVISENFFGILINQGAINISVKANKIGTDATGNNALHNFDGVIIDNSTNVTIGGDNPSDGNVISGCSYKGIWVKNNNVNLQIKNNHLGTNTAGDAALPNTQGIFFDNANPLATVEVRNNLISGNSGHGIFVWQEYGKIALYGNYIGTDATGNTAIPNPFGIFTNSFNGVLQIGDSVPGNGNVISGNENYGVFFKYGKLILQNNIIGLNPSKEIVMGNGGYDVFVENSEKTKIGGIGQNKGNYIGGNTSTGIYLGNADSASVIGNFIGNTSTGIYLMNSESASVIGNFVGVTEDGLLAGNYNGIIVNNSHYVSLSKNLVSANTQYNIQVIKSNDTRIYANKIGTDLTGTRAMDPASGADGINADSCGNIEIGGSNASDGNIISGNHNGIFLYDYYNNPLIENNKIGVDSSGNSGIGNDNGIYVKNGDSLTVKNNIISGNRNIGLCLDHVDSSTVESNLVGLSSNGSELGNGEDGIRVLDSKNNSLTKNTVTGNEWAGIEISTSSDDNELYGNFIGTDSTGSRNMGNKGNGIVIETECSDNIIGGTAIAQANIIAFNTGSGVLVTEYASSNRISGNRIYYNTEKGINLLLDDESDHNDGNDSKPKPVITAINYSSGVLNITGTSSSKKDTIQFFTSDADGEDGLLFLKEYTTLTDGSASWSASIPLTEAPGGYIVVTATDTISNTSEFSIISGITNCPSGTPVFTISVPCPGKPLITGRNTLFTVDNFEQGFLYAWDMEGDGTPNITSSTAETYYSYYSGGTKTVTVAKIIGNCSVSSNQELEVQELNISTDMPALCQGQIATISVIPDDLDPSDYVWYRNDVLLDSIGPTLQVDNWGTYKVEIPLWSCSGSSSLVNMRKAALNSPMGAESETGETASKTILVVERVCPPPIGCGDCISPFSPEPGKTYILSAWVMEDDAAFLETYERAGVKIDFNVMDVSGDIIKDQTLSAFRADPASALIDGWQRIEGAFTVPANAVGIDITLLQSTEVDIYYDDIRIHPSDANAKTYVYDPVTFRLMAILDENNYATIYEYDREGKLIRVKKETERGVMTIQENLNNTYKSY